MIGMARGRWTWSAPLLLFLAVLLVAGLAFNIANLDGGGESLPDVPDAGGTTPSSRGLIDADVVVNGVLALMVATLIVGVGVALRSRRRYPRREAGAQRSWDYLGPLLSLVILLALIVLWPRIAAGLRGSDAGSGDDVGSGLPHVGWPNAAGIPAAIFLLAAVLGGFLVLAYLVRRSPVLRGPPSRGAVVFPRRAASEVVRDTIADLELGGDVRATILGCFQRFCALLGRRGLLGQEAMTPGEIENAAIRRLRVRAEDASTLTALFEEARYSEHPLEEDARQRALGSLRGIRAVLEA